MKEDYKVVLKIINNDGKIIGATTIGCNMIKHLKEFHDVSGLDELYNQLLLDIEKK